MNRQKMFWQEKGKRKLIDKPFVNSSKITHFNNHFEIKVSTNE